MIETTYRASNGRLIRRVEIIGRESHVPFLGKWYYAETGEFLGAYSRESLAREPFMEGPMFGR